MFGVSIGNIFGYVEEKKVRMELIGKGVVLQMFG